MKKLILVSLLMAFAGTVIVAHATETHKVVKARGQPKNEFLYEIPSIEIVAVSIAKIRPMLSIKIRDLEKIAPTVLKSDNRKVRDVDWCSTGEYNYNNTDKENAITDKTVRLARGSLSRFS